MKYLLYITIFLAVGVMSCDDFVDLDPQTQIPAENALVNGPNVEATLFASYEQLTADPFLGGRVMFYSIMLGDNYQTLFPINPTDFTGQVISRNVNEVNIEVDEVWSTGFRAIARANAVIDAIDNNAIIDGTDPALLNQWKGEALFIRAVAHFELVRLFGQPYSNNPETDLGVPIRLTALTQDEKLPRSTVAEVYARVVTDLTEALTLVEDNVLNRANRETVQAYLSRVYFNMLDYDNAFAVSNELLDETEVEFRGTPLTAFRNTGNVAPAGGIFFQAVRSGNFFSGFRPVSISFAMATGDGSISEALEASADNDLRFTEGVEVTADNTFTLKWDDTNINRPIIRLAEIHLIRAESALLKATPEEDVARESFDGVRQFSVEDHMNTTLTGDALLEAIRLERRLELYMEGDRYHELRRLRSDSFGEIPGVRDNVSFNDPSLPLGIPFSEIAGS